MAVPPVPEQPAACRRANAWRSFVSSLPAVGCVFLLFTGHPGWAASVFFITFGMIGFGTVIPWTRLWAPHVSHLGEEQAQRGEVWLTLDDGPDPVTTPIILDLLDQHDAKAGFFLIGSKAVQHPDLVREIVRRGHLVGNHSQTHPAAYFWALRPAGMWAEVAGGQQTLTNILGEPPVWFRPPVGHHNFYLAATLRALGLTMAIWDCRGFDGILQDPARVMEHVRRSLRPGSIVLLHDGPPRCVEIVEATLNLFKERGLQAVLPTSLQPAAATPTLPR